MYHERASAIPGARVWTGVSDGSPHRVLPDGCMDLLWIDERLVVAGPDTTAFLSSSHTGAVSTGLRFAPGGAPAVLGVPAVEFHDRRVPLADVWPATDVARAEDVIGDASRPGRALEDLVVAMSRSPQRGAPDPLSVEVARRARAGEPIVSIATATNMSTRQLQRRSRDLFGYGPKMLSRVLRLQAALDLARTDVALATVAARCGYADQPHLADEVRALTGTTLSDLGLGARGQARPDVQD